jgi:hypothetical protein
MNTAYCEREREREKCTNTLLLVDLDRSLEGHFAELTVDTHGQNVRM